MIIVCDRCKKSTVEFDQRDKWLRLDTSTNKMSKLRDYYLCPKCRYDFYDFINNKTVNVEEEK